MRLRVTTPTLLPATVVWAGASTHPASHALAPSPLRRHATHVASHRLIPATLVIRLTPGAGPAGLRSWRLDSESSGPL